MYASVVVGPSPPASYSVPPLDSPVITLIPSTSEVSQRLACLSVALGEMAQLAEAAMNAVNQAAAGAAAAAAAAPLPGAVPLAQAPLGVHAPPWPPQLNPVPVPLALLAGGRRRLPQAFHFQAAAAHSGLPLWAVSRSIIAYWDIVARELREGRTFDGAVVTFSCNRRTGVITTRWLGSTNGPPSRRTVNP